MKIVARILSGLGILAILAAGVCVVILLELDIEVGDLLPMLVAGIVGGLVIGVALIVLSALIAPGSVGFPLFRPGRGLPGSGTEQEGRE